MVFNATFNNISNWILDICLVLLFQVLKTCICLTNMQIFCIFLLLDAFSKQNDKIFLWSINNLLRWLFCKKLHQNCMKNKKVKIWNSVSFIRYLCTLKGPSWSWLYGSLIYNYLCKQCLSPLRLWVWIQNDKIFLWSINNLLRWLFCKKLHQNCMKNKKVKIWNSAFVGPFQLSLSFETIKDRGNLLTFLKS
jgi:hypothetical protein